MEGLQSSSLESLCSAPPPYQANTAHEPEKKGKLEGKEGEQEEVIEGPSIPRTAAETTGGTVKDTDCIAHLEFLAALAHLRETICSTPGIFDIGGVGRYDEFLAQEDILLHVREKVWQVYVSRAVDRFTQWWETRPTYKERPTVMSLKRFEMDPLAIPESVSIPLTKDNLPPLDVLMVWHTFLLNPRAYLEDCFRQARMNLWVTPFPLELVASCINSHYEYDPGPIAQDRWRRETNRCWNNLDDPETYTLKCLSCQSHLEVPWTTAHIGMLCPPTAPWAHLGFGFSRGYADKEFYVWCSSCRQSLTHDSLAGLRFHLDNLALVHSELALPGTVFNPNGVIKSRYKWGAKWTQLSANYYFLHFKKPFLEVMRNDHGREPHSLWNIAIFIWRELYQHDRKIKALDLHTDLSSERLFGGTMGWGRGTLRRMMSRYMGGNSSIFALDLVGAVIRQGAFIEKMHKLDWLHVYSTETLRGVMQRFIDKYGVFWSIIVHNPSRIVVPTLDVDLVWHTHQLSAREYYANSIRTTAARKPVRFIDHNDKIDEGRLSDSFEWTVKQYRKATNGGVYSECSCWYCEATRGRGFLERLSLASPTGEATDSKSQAHISSHNAVRSEGKIVASTRKKLDKIIEKHQRTLNTGSEPEGKSGKGKEKAKEVARQDLFEVFAPDTPLHREAYITNPSCMNGDLFAHASCIPDACSASMAAGSCGGSTFRSACATDNRHHGDGFFFTPRSTVSGGVGGPACGGGGGGGC